MPTATGKETPSIRLVHLSDIHITASPLGWQLGDWFTKRVTGWFNLRCLGRRHRFRLADVALAKLASELRQKPPDHVVFSGDATALGFEVEFARAAEILGVSGDTPLPGIAVPGNHDYYTPDVARSGFFERYFAPWQKGLRVDDALYPFAQRVGPLWLIGVNSSTGNRWIFDAAGSVGAEQVARLRTLLERLDPGPRILVTHYPVCLADGRPERHNHGLRDLDAILNVAKEGGVCLWLHGHRHHPYCITDRTLAPFPVICAGSTTQSQHWSYGDYTITGNQLQAIRKVYSPEHQEYRETERFEFPLPG